MHHILRYLFAYYYSSKFDLCKNITNLARMPLFSNLSINTGNRSIPGDAIAILDIVTIEIPCTAAVVELTPIFSPASVVSGIPKDMNEHVFVDCKS